MTRNASDGPEMPEEAVRWIKSNNHVGKDCNSYIMASTAAYPLRMYESFHARFAFSVSVPELVFSASSGRSVADVSGHEQSITNNPNLLQELGHDLRRWPGLQVRLLDVS